MGVLLRLRRLPAPLAGAALVAALITVAAPPASAAPADLSGAAREVAEARKALNTAEEAADSASSQSQAAQQALQEASTAAAEAADEVRRTKSEAEKAAKLARRATVKEGDTARTAAAARSEMVRIARSVYMSGGDNAELAAFVDFAILGPSALNGLASHNIAADRIEVGIVDKVARTGAAAERAAADAQSARDGFIRADDAKTAARKALVRSKDELDSAEAAEGKAAKQDRAAQADLAQAQERFDRAKERFDSELEASGGSAGAVATAPSASPGNQAQLVWDILIAEGFSEESVAGILGNLQQESNIDPTTIQNGGPGRGLAQWSAGGRWDNGPNSLLAFAGSRGLDPWSAVTQTKFMIYEMGLGWGGFDPAKYKRMTDVLAATVYFHDEFEGSADSSAFVRAVRGGYAMHWYNTLKG